MQAALFMSAAIIWGLTWYGIHLQIGATPDIVSIFWRFAISAVLIWLGLLVTGQVKPASWRQHRWFAAMGLTLFSCNFLCFYAAQHSIPSGLVSVVFSIASVFNTLNQWAFRGIRPSPRILAGAAMGLAGVFCLFALQILGSGPAHYLVGVLCALGGTYLFSIGNLASGQAIIGVTLPNAIARSMSWGSLFLGAGVLLTGHGFSVPFTLPYLGGLAYLSAIGSVAGFLAYLSLVARIGPSRAAYTTIISPVVALAVSSVFEGYTWTGLSIAGIALVLAGNLVIFTPSRKPRSTTITASSSR